MQCGEAPQILNRNGAFERPMGGLFRFSVEMVLSIKCLRVVVLTVVWACCVGGLAPSLMAAESAEATQQINKLITHVEGLTDVTFIRNGKEYTAQNAAKFLRAKRKAKSDEISTASDFIEKVASYSGTTGKPYTIRLKDGSVRSHGEYLKGVLAGMK